MTSRTQRLALAAVVGGVLVCSGAGAAQAADQGAPSPLSASDVAAATSVAGQGEGLALAKQVALKQADSDQSTDPSLGSQSLLADTPSLVPGTTTQVNVLSRDFVTSASGPVARLSYVANSAKLGGQVVTVWSMKAKDGSGWKAVNAAAGDLEARLADQAQGGALFREPQINAWYTLKNGRVLPLNDEARNAVGDQGVTLGTYQRIVHVKYADKQPGSSYDRQGMAGGFGAPAKPAAAAPVAHVTEQGTSSSLVVGGLGALGVVGAAGLMASRRRAAR